MLLASVRSLLSVAFMAAMLHAMNVAVLARPAVRIVDNDLSSQGIRIRGAASQEFAADMARLVHGRLLPNLDWILPYSAIIENTSSLPLVAVVVQYELIAQNGNSTYDTILMNEFDLESAARQMPPSAIRYIGPSRLARMVLNSKQPPPSHVIGALEAEAIEVGGSYAKLREVRIILDSVVFADGAMIGPDSFRAADRFNAWLQAESGLLRELNTLNGNPKAEAMALELLRNRASADLAGSGPYTQRQGALAGALLNWHRIGGVAELFRQAAVIAKRPRLQRVVRLSK